MTQPNQWTQPASPPPPLFVGKVERNFVKQARVKNVIMVDPDTLFSHLRNYKLLDMFPYHNLE